MTKKIKIGDWAFVTGSQRISPEMWKRSFPNDWFGKIIDIQPMRLGSRVKYYTLRCYRKKRKDDSQKHPHLKTTKQFIKLYN